MEASNPANLGFSRAQNGTSVMPENLDLSTSQTVSSGNSADVNCLSHSHASHLFKSRAFFLTFFR